MLIVIVIYYTLLNSHRIIVNKHRQNASLARGKTIRPMKARNQALPKSTSNYHLLIFCRRFGYTHVFSQLNTSGGWNTDTLDEDCLINLTFEKFYMSLLVIYASSASPYYFTYFVNGVRCRKRPILLLYILNHILLWFWCLIPNKFDKPMWE